MNGGVRHELGSPVDSFTTTRMAASDSHRGAKRMGMERTHTALNLTRVR
jgi:hypothetical protein